MKRKWLIMLLAAVCMLLPAACAVGNDVRDMEKETEYLPASWSYHYEDLKELSQASDLIALVTVREAGGTTVESGVPYTVFPVTVIRPVFGSEKDQVFSIYMTGGETEDRIVEVEGDPLPQPGDEMLVFCAENPDGTFRILGGSQGRLICEDGKFRSPDAAGRKSGQAEVFSGIVAEDADVDALIREIGKYLTDKA